MVVMDTPNSAYDKVSIDIMGSLPTTESEHSYILIQDSRFAYQIFSGGTAEVSNVPK